jgi:hypothetical protein
MTAEENRMIILYFSEAKLFLESRFKSTINLLEFRDETFKKYRSKNQKRHSKKQPI